mmetsp:Transcript_19602/g.52890  ORF Transcript_19602/g.52890 Transcript_19602/m.52890 type:complete len:350 (+) Transcript_19602:2355-3404(+)
MIRHNPTVWVQYPHTVLGKFSSSVSSCLLRTLFGSRDHVEAPARPARGHHRRNIGKASYSLTLRVGASCRARGRGARGFLVAHLGSLGARRVERGGVALGGAPFTLKLGGHGRVTLTLSHAAALRGGGGLDLVKVGAGARVGDGRGLAADGGAHLVVRCDQGNGLHVLDARHALLGEGAPSGRVRGGRRARLEEGGAPHCHLGMLGLELGDECVALLDAARARRLHALGAFAGTTDQERANGADATGRANGAARGAHGRGLAAVRIAVEGEARGEGSRHVALGRGEEDEALVGEVEGARLERSRRRPSLCLLGWRAQCGKALGLSGLEAAVHGVDDAGARLLCSHLARL